MERSPYLGSEWQEALRGALARNGSIPVYGSKAVEAHLQILVSARYVTFRPAIFREFSIRPMPQVVALANRGRTGLEPGAAGGDAARRERSTPGRACAARRCLEPSAWPVPTAARGAHHCRVESACSRISYARGGDRRRTWCIDALAVAQRRRRPSPAIPLSSGCALRRAARSGCAAVQRGHGQLLPCGGGPAGRPRSDHALVLLRAISRGATRAVLLQRRQLDDALPGAFYCAASVNSAADLTLHFVGEFFGAAAARQVEGQFSPEIRRPLRAHRASVRRRCRCAPGRSDPHGAGLAARQPRRQAARAGARGALRAGHPHLQPALPRRRRARRRSRSCATARLEPRA
jgi:hypothetical protein